MPVGTIHTLAHFSALVGDAQFFYLSHHSPRDEQHIVGTLFACAGLHQHQMAFAAQDDANTYAYAWTVVDVLDAVPFVVVKAVGVMPSDAGDRAF